ncbi:NADPH-dependent F420 reductase [Sphingobium yanoikuyae]|uniref:NAD(P)-binding domain-containing protein n=1 Tax=Sphingobium yanoikuyae TaxID=13690 RepID=A0A9X7U927_SPHYA|nr:NAD(P)-binding domain-containing protein [Sphingobium yanoikuyae]QNG44164.1 NAD(P)-binding domain-containing protein [Sphingobium yanoikuyae]
MTIGIIGAGNIGGAFAKALGKAGIEAVISNSRGPGSIAELVSTFGGSIRAGTVTEAAAQDIVLVAVQWSKIPGALAGLDLGGKVVIDANNPIEAPLYRPVDLGGRISSDVFANLVPGARVVKAFNHLTPAQLSGDPHSEGGKRVLFYSGDDRRAKAEVAAIIDQIGFFGIDLGSLSIGGQLVQFPGGALPALNLVKFG